MVTSSQVALQVVQQAIAILAKWAKFDYTFQGNEYPEVKRAKSILGWTEDKEVGTLRLLFDDVNLSDEPKKESSQIHYHKLMAVDNDNQQYPDIPYPLNCEPSETEQKDFKEKINQELSKYLKENLENLSLLMLILEKFGSCLSFGESNVALVDIARTTAAVSTALIDNPAEEISLIAGDLSGIQKFIYTISSDGALKSLRARSFYLELVTEEVVQQLLEELELPRTNIIYAGGGNLYLIGNANEQTSEKVKKVKYKFNSWLNIKFQSKVFLALDYVEFPVINVANNQFAQHWKKVINKVNQQKKCKFEDKIYDLLKPRTSYSDRCKVCHRDDTKDLKPLTIYEGSSILACSICYKMFQLGDKLFNIESIVRSSQADSKAVDTISFELGDGSEKNYYNLYNKHSQLIVKNTDNIFLINNWRTENYKFKYFNNEITPLLLGNYGKKNQEERRFIRAEEMAEVAQGIKKVGYLRMDVDNLGKIFAKGLGEYKTLLLPRIAGLSRQMSYFFKVYLNSLANNRRKNLPDNPKTLTLCTNEEKFIRTNLLFIYSGGDDLFISGAWNEIVELSFDIYQSFRAHTGYNPDITLSGGISINDVKYPLYQAANDAGNAQESAKSNNKDSLSLFAEAFKWGEWVRTENLFFLLDSNMEKYFEMEAQPKISSVLDFVIQLTSQLELSSDYSRNFIRNLLDTAETQEQMIKQLSDQELAQADDIRYYLHLPKLAYALSRLPKTLHTNPDFTDVRQSLMNPRNAHYFRAIATWIELLTRSR